MALKSVFVYSFSSEKLIYDRKQIIWKYESTWDLKVGQFSWQKSSATSSVSDVNWLYLNFPKTLGD